MDWQAAILDWQFINIIKTVPDEKRKIRSISLLYVKVRVFPKRTPRAPFDHI